MPPHPLQITTPSQLSCIDATTQAVRANAVVSVSGSSTISLTNVKGTVLHDATDADRPVKTGARARTTPITPVANDDRTDLLTDVYGRLQCYEFPQDGKSLRGTYTVMASSLFVTSLPNVNQRWWLVNPPGSGITSRVVRLRFLCQAGSALVVPTSPLLTIQRFAFSNSSFSGTSNASLANAFVNHRTSYAAALSRFFVNTSDSTISDTGLCASFMPVCVMTASGALYPASTDIPLTYPRWIELAEGEGIRLTQVGNGTASDTRRFRVIPTISEFA